MTTQRILAVSAGLGVPSSSRMLADQLADAVRAELASPNLPVEVEAVELRDYAVDIANNFLTGFPAPALASVVDRLTRADALLVVSPVFSGSYSGLLKSFFDVLDPAALEGMPVLMGATGGSARHALMLEHAMRPLFTYLRAVVVPTGVYASPEDWGSGEASIQPLEQRIHRAARELGGVLRNSPRTFRTGQDPVPFQELLDRAAG
ncbi:FMN reductase [Arthrobacter sp. MSA 4-2]|uniref:FMN reductase n=1 Tax=Arthrobacter sp. MSA 4-2 TaxID=2794349 RepID=UPI0018E70DD1|nr:FMN reductase [Arthrobacter sp. MSA 4-2]MBJ2122418.1 FMN reductase [Arthrobacter sp. MSA 4-2]